MSDAPDLARRPLSIGISCFPTFGGSGIVATEIGSSLARRGHRVHFIASDVPGRLDRFQENVFFHEVEARDYPVFSASPYTLALASKMVEVARYERLDLLHVHYAIPHAASAYLARQILRTTRAATDPPAPAIVTTLHGTDITLVGSDASFLPITRFAIVESDGVTVPSDALAAETRARFDIAATFPIETIPNFVDTDRFCPPDARAPERLRHLFPRCVLAERERPRLFAHNSNFREVKRVGDVLRAFARLDRALAASRAADGDRVRALLVLIGDGPERSRMEDLARELGVAERACFLGKQREFVAVLQQADALLLPSETESFGLAALEAMSCGVPVIASRVGGLPEVVTDGESGFLHAVGDVDAIVAAALRLATDGPLRDRMGEAARARAVSRFPREPTVSRYEGCYRRVLERTGRAGP